MAIGVANQLKERPLNCAGALAISSASAHQRASKRNCRAAELDRSVGQSLVNQHLLGHHHFQRVLTEYPRRSSSDRQ